MSKGPRIWTLAELEAQPEPEWLVRGVVPAQGVGMIFGPTEAGKTFLALDLALAVASAPSRESASERHGWLGHRVNGGLVVYVAAEAAYSLRPRVQAWRRMHPQAEPNFYVVPDAINMMSATDTASLQEAIDRVDVLHEVALVVLDTWAKMTPGADEDSRQEMGKALDSVESIRRAFDCAVVLVHHTGHEGTRARGSSSLMQSVDWAGSVAVKDGQRAMRCAKMRDAAYFPPIGFRLAECAPSLIVEPEEAPATPTGTLEKSEQLALDALRGAAGPVSFTFWLTASGLSKTSFRRALNGLLARDLVTKGALGYSLKGSEGPRATEGPNGAVAPGLKGPKGPPPFRVALGSDPGPDSDEAIERAALASEDA